MIKKITTELGKDFYKLTIQGTPYHNFTIDYYFYEHHCTALFTREIRSEEKVEVEKFNHDIERGSYSYSFNRIYEKEDKNK